jgi:diguanylate cyclase (GGDEF)-like protein
MPMPAANTQALARELALRLAAADPAAQFATHFQPVVDLRKQRILGYEALTRGPADTPLQDPLVLFTVARDAGLLIALEQVLVRTMIQRFRIAGLPGQLFVKVSAPSLAAAARRLTEIREEILHMLLPPTRVVVEVTDTQSAYEAEALARTLRELRQLGMVIAVRDGEDSFPGLLRWAALRPDFIKLDRKLSADISLDAHRADALRALSILARQLGTTLIASGVESADDLRVLQKSGVPVGQGFLFARPAARPETRLQADAQAMLEASTGRAADARERYEGLQITAGDLARRGCVVSPGLSCRDVVEIFLHDPELYSLVVLDDSSRPVGQLRRLDVLSRASGRFFSELNGNRPCALLMDRSPTLFDAGVRIDEMSSIVAGLRESYLIDGFVVTENGRYFGSGRFGDLLKAVNELQLAFARHANPLTLLPGNAVIDQHVDVALGEERPFLVAYFDLDHFKPFNDVYGYKAGDDVIRLCARLIQDALDAREDFLGHVGGDDFVAVMHSPDAEQRLRALLPRFDEAVVRFFHPEHVAAGGYTATDRQGRTVLHPLVSLSVGVLPVQPGDFHRHAEVARHAADAKKQAKKTTGSALFIERRRSFRAGNDDE